MMMPKELSYSDLCALGQAARTANNEILSLRAQLAASEARVKVLREALSKLHIASDNYQYFEGPVTNLELEEALENSCKAFDATEPKQ